MEMYAFNFRLWGNAPGQKRLPISPFPDQLVIPMTRPHSYQGLLDNYGSLGYYQNNGFDGAASWP